MKTYQHGDVLIIEVESIPATARKQKRKGDLILMEGELTGHAHRVKESKVDSYIDDAMLYIEALLPCEVTHEEHNTIALPPGKYRIAQVREYDHLEEAERFVAD